MCHNDKKAKITRTGGAGKAVVMGILDRERGKVRVKHVENVQRETLQAEIYKHVEEGSEVFADAWVAYTGLDRDYVHGVIDRAEATSTGRFIRTESRIFWSLLKRG